jgi:hypothetical protein
LRAEGIDLDKTSGQGPGSSSEWSEKGATESQWSHWRGCGSIDVLHLINAKLKIGVGPVRILLKAASFFSSDAEACVDRI